MKTVRFIRAMGVLNLHTHALSEYKLTPKELGIPDTVFHNPMTLIPLKVINEWYRRIEQLSGDPDLVLNLLRDVDILKLGPVGRWLFSGNDLASAIRRVNYGVSNLQSGAFFAGAQSGNILKWTYHNPFIDADIKVHESVRSAVFMVKILREFLGKDYKPLRVKLSGSRQNNELYKAYFGCDVEWNQPKTEVWLQSHDRLATRQVLYREERRLAMSFSDLDDLLNMPDPEDELKVIYEVVNYSRHYGLPTLERVSHILGLSEQQFQRRLQKLGLNFSTISGYVLSNVAVEWLNKGVAISDVATRLGYTNVTSFNRMFKKHRGVTPKQFLLRAEN
ncbi:AraC family transcriptional regulator ligand-binding domain-containing protein [Vibrio alfacsensis]|uniref:AraC family transcriptional regulator ligand-binding domain-containing protein n=1 Tax=Vibrio alfacsensis TaxID=1074311 RepID=UPI002ADD71C8|nr:AraC family transcriptional regulator ligand-binding domain-containing protein [Vibrio alfacsensis]WQE78565.1 AraC family transcriptional regulator ligand-binding domain-containing protein [Vibrio alfacsensis]